MTNEQHNRNFALGANRDEPITAPFKVRYDCTGDGYKGYPERSPEGHVTPQGVHFRRPNNRLLRLPVGILG